MPTSNQSFCIESLTLRTGWFVYKHCKVSKSCKLGGALLNTEKCYLMLCASFLFWFVSKKSGSKGKLRINLKADFCHPSVTSISIWSQQVKYYIKRYERLAFRSVQQHESIGCLSWHICGQERRRRTVHALSHVEGRRLHRPKAVHILQQYKSMQKRQVQV